MGIFGVIVLIVVIAIIYKKARSHSKSEIEKTVSNHDTSEESKNIVTDDNEFSNDEVVDLDELISNNSVLSNAYKTLSNIVEPDKYGSYNEAKTIGKTIAKINEQVSTILTPGSAAYKAYFTGIYRAVISSMANSQDELMRSAMNYTLSQYDEWQERGKCQTFVKGLSDDELVVYAELIMTACEKCWFNNVKTTMWRKDMEKYDLPKSI